MLEKKRCERDKIEFCNRIWRIYKRKLKRHAIGIFKVSGWWRVVQRRSMNMSQLMALDSQNILLTGNNWQKETIDLTTIDPYCWNEILTLRGKFTQQNKWHVIAFLWEIKGKWTKVSYSERKSHFHSPVFDWLFKEFIICPFKIANIFPLSLWNDVVFLSR